MTKSKVKVDNTTLERDIHSKALLETSTEEYTVHLRRRDKERKMKTLESKMDKLIELLEKNGVSLDDL